MTMRVLVVDDDAAMRETLLQTLGADLDVVAAESGEHALSMLAKVSPDVILTDVRMPGLDGLELLRLLRERAPGVDVILMSAFDDMPTVVAAMREGARDFLAKPLDLHDVRRVLARAPGGSRTRDLRTKRANAHWSSSINELR
jgi:DNA-binding NtrC family response regulator